MVPLNEMNKKLAGQRINRFGPIAAALLFAALVAYGIYFVSISSPMPPQAR